MGNVILSADRVSFGYPDSDALAVAAVSFEVKQGQLVAILGPNGGGKTTLVRLLLGTLTPVEGSVEILGTNSGEWSRRKLARQVGVVTQQETAAFPLRVREAVMLGRYPHLGSAGAVTAADRGAVDSAMRKTDVAYLADRWTHTLSGGEWQRVRLARALAQGPRLLVLDEPTANLDLRHEMEVFELAAQLVETDGISVVAVTHNVNLAARFADRVVVLSGGKLEASGSPADVLNPEMLGSVFGWPVDQFEWEGQPQFIPLRRKGPPEK